MTGERLRAGELAQAVRAERLVVVLRRIEPRERLVALVDELADSGVRIFEVTFDAASAAEDVAALKEHLAGRHDGPHWIGAGTLLGDAQLAAAQAAGASFGVSPLLDLPMVRMAIERGLPFVPGTFTPTEMAAAWTAGATFVKLFPASAVGAQFVRELRGPLPEVEIIPTGGVDVANAADFLAAGAAAVGIGGAIVRADAGQRRALLERLRQA